MKVGYELKDYKFFCFNGKVKYIQVDFDRFNNHKKNIYDIDWKLQDFEINYPSDKSHKIKKPENLEKMIEIAEKLSKHNIFLRVDLYSIKKQILFGELTFFPGGGLMPFKPEVWDLKLGEMIRLPK